MGLTKEITHTGWMDIMSWYYDVVVGSYNPLETWVDKAVETRGVAVARVSRS